MTRSLPEWIGKTDDEPVPLRVKLRVFERHDVRPDRALMAGDSLRSDILPALSAGAFAAHIPHAMPWAHEMAEEPADHLRYRKLDRLGEVVAWIDAL